MLPGLLLLLSLVLVLVFIFIFILLVLVAAPKVAISSKESKLLNSDSKAAEKFDDPNL